MDPTSLASAIAGAQMSRVQMAVAAKMLKMNAQAEAGIAQVLEAAQDNMKNVANLAAGVGQSLDISV
jgi:hypothetical protein